LVEGPPGTGKTTFISVLVSEEIRRNPKAHILLASQTHVAIDNAIEKINKIDNKIKIIRIANNQFSNVAELSEAYLMSNQLKSWRNEVFERAEKGLENWSTSHNLDLKHIKIGIVIRQIANVSENINSCRQKIEEEENRKSELEKETGENSSSIDNSIEIDRISEELNEFRTQLDVGKKELDGLKKSIIAITPEAQEFLDETIKDQLIWADTLVGSSEEEKLAKSLIKLQADWFYRFGSMEGFVKPLIERASVVAATCVGLAAIGEINELDFDLCIIDEASKATAMESAVPMARAKKWVLVGDSKQLGPFQEEILRKPELKERFEIGSPEASETMFQRFLRLLPKENRVRLTHQYRMVVPIRDLMNECFYGDLEGGKDSIDRIICSYTGKAVNWFSTSQVERRMEQGIGNTFSNQEEVTRICELVLAIEQSINKLSAKKKVNDNKTIPTLVLSGYEAQTKLLKSRLNQITRDLKTLKIECSTIDQVQGREADVVIFSLTRSNKDSKVGFLKELERINVALSRARELLYIIGDDRFVVRAENAQSLQKVLNHIKNSPDCYFRELKN
jgi:superfamily I DNA and/or RNA helicase